LKEVGAHGKPFRIVGAHGKSFRKGSETMESQLEMKFGARGEEIFEWEARGTIDRQSGK